MGLVAVLKALTEANAVQRSGELERTFYASVYRFIYISGLSTSDHTLGYLLYGTIMKSMLVTLMLAEGCYIFSESLTLDTISNCINVFTIQFIAAYRYISMINNIQNFKSLATSMESPNFDISTPARKKLVHFWANTNETYLKLILALGTGTIVVWFVYPLIDDLEYNLIAAVYLPFDYQNPTWYPPTYVALCIMFANAAYFVMVNDLTIQAHLMNLLCQFTVLGDCFENLMGDCATNFKGIPVEKLVTMKEFMETYTKRLKNLVDQHVFILHHTMELRRVLSTPMLGQFAGSTLLICFIGFQAIGALSDNITKLIMSVMFLGYNLFEVFMICRWCDEIKIQSEKIRDAVYSSGWEHGMAAVPGVRLRLLLVIMRASKPVVLTAGGLYELSLVSFSTIVKTSYSVLTVLLRVRH